MRTERDTIAAAATPEMVSAVAVIRISGPDAVRIVEEEMKLSTGRLRGMRRKVGDFGGIDWLVALSWPEGKSYTGEEMVDLMCHGSPGTPNAVLKRLLEKGARKAEPGEFTRRAWMGGKLTSMDVLALSAKYRNIKTGNTGRLLEHLMELTVETEALIEFQEEHETASEGRFQQLLKEAWETAESLAEEAERMEILPTVHIMGPVNSGKSTLLNRLTGRTAAVVSEQPGTTRDGATELVYAMGRQIRVMDTAGTGGTELDSMGLSISMNKVKRGDRIIWMDREQNTLTLSMEDHQVLLLASQRDREDTPLKEGWYPHSSVSGMGQERILDFMAKSLPHSPSIAFRVAAGELRNAAVSAENGDMALAAEQINAAMDEMRGKLTAGEAVERALDTFCVGK